VNVLDLLRLAKLAPAQTQSARAGGWSLVAAAAVALAALGLLRLALGWVGVVRVVRRSRPVTDPWLLAVADELRLRLGCRRPVAVRESSAVASAATAGWRKPVILLAPGWRAWTPLEARAVLAHEIAHAARGDFAARLLARLAAALHGYHPLARWAAARLELHQEMAADTSAAAACGGRPAYLRCLAALALKADAAPVGPVPTFLSGPRTLLRRIAMLRVKDDTPTHSRRWPALACIVLLAAAALGLHGTAPEALADPAPRAGSGTTSVRPPLDVSFVLPSADEDVVGVYAVRVGELAREPSLTEVAEQTAALFTALGGKKARFAVADVEQVSGRVSLKHDPTKPAPNRSLMLSLTSVRMAKDFDWVGQLRDWCAAWQEHTHAGTKYYSGKFPAPLFGIVGARDWFYLPDARTLVVETEENVQALIAAGGKPARPAWAADWTAVESGVFGLVMTHPRATARKVKPAAGDGDATERRVGLAAGEILSKADRVVIGFDAGRTCELSVTVNCPTREDCEAAARACEGLVTWAEEQRKAAAAAGMSLHAQTSLAVRRGVDFGPPVRHQTGVRIEFHGGLGDLVKAVRALTGEKK
jgi:beta-lactamase regulating signal transducer with metallopeptidase domain